MKMDVSTRQEIHFLINNMLIRYAQLNDAGHWDELAHMFARDGRFIRPSAPTDVIVGREAILNALKARPDRVTRHIVTNVLVFGDHPAHLTAHSTVLLFQGEPAASAEELPTMSPNSPLVGTFDDIIVLEPQGYVFAERRGALDFAP